MPLPAQGSRLGFRVARSDTGATLAGPGTQPLPALICPRRVLERALGRQLGPGQQVTITGPAGWITASVSREGRDSAHFENLSPGQILDALPLSGLRALVRWY